MMEAHSLAALNLQAANPPQYPENPSERIQEPLVLYISRVPGTRDVILSPFKPQLKNVTGGDVASSLYYVHLELPMLDITGPQPLRDEPQGRSSEDSSATRTIARKPVPSSISSLPPEISIQSDQPQLQQTRGNYENTTLRPPGDLGMPPSLQETEYAPPLPPRRRFQDSGLGYSDGSFETNPYERPQLNVPAPKRKPVGPRQMSDVPQGRVSMDETTRSRAQTRDRADTTGRSRQSRSLSPTKNIEYSTPPFTLSLIRRDPGTGDQWNVGKISSYEANPMAAQTPMYLSASSEQQPPQHPPIDIQIETAGYAKFRGGPPIALPPRTSMDSRSFIDVVPESRTDNRSFSRQVSMSYSRSFGSALRSKFHQFEQAARKKAQAHNRNGSEASVASHSSGEYVAGSPTAARPEKMKPRGYTFASPWNGRCEFRTGNGGRSLLCHHILHEGEVGAYNPLVPDSSAAKGTSTVVSELRFNLPGSDLFPSSELPKGDSDHKLGHFAKFVKSAVDRGYGDEDEDDFVSPFDVNVGGERAGGGNRGNRAKLGKLIIYHDGMKMLDLLVAANMGLWWGTWEKSY
ncbi:uncharacterized protein TrAFT101_005518 [Trichoderma asperellum]|uniref:uncharacterized protein n=1 Tax=Trichoderma asperellum TaxID=101201 RepID=UPI00332FA534|nr:hypothetical protein TrAFT101_005518 [Trichoderma asperellum]